MSRRAFEWSDTIPCSIKSQVPIRVSGSRRWREKYRISEPTAVAYTLDTTRSMLLQLNMPCQQNLLRAFIEVSKGLPYSTQRQEVR